MKMTLGMPSYRNYSEVFFTVQSLRMHHNLKDTEILVVDNFGDPQLEAFCKNQGRGVVRYEKYTEVTGPANAKNQIFEFAKGDMVMCIDSHILLKPGSLENLPQTDDLVQGTLMYDDMVNFGCDWKNEWRGHMWGIWGQGYNETTLPKDPFEIWGMGMGLFMCSKSGWLGFNKKFKGFGGEEGYIHEKYRKAGRKCWCYPHIVWGHLFNKPIAYPLNLIDRVINYVIGFRELNMDLKPIEDHFGQQLFVQAVAEADKR